MMTLSAYPRRLHGTDVMLLLLIALLVFVLHLVTNGQYGFHRDELDTLDNARALDWGTVAYPPFTPFIGRLGLDWFGGSLIGVRSFAALSQALGVILVGLMVKLMGGGRAALIVAPLAVAIAPVALTAGLMLHYLSFDYLWWVFTAAAVLARLRTGDPRWWLAVGAGIGLGMMTKYTMGFFAIGIVVGTLLTPLRRDLLNRWLWLGVALACLIVLPNLIWQAQHDFVSLKFMSAIHERDVAWGRTSGFLGEQLTSSLNPLTLPLFVAGWIFVVFSPRGRAFRMLTWMFIVPFALFMAVGGRSYYIAPAYPMLLAAGGVWLEGYLSDRSPRVRRAAYALSGTALAAGGALGIALILPVTPIQSPLWKTANNLSENFRDMIGWPELVSAVAEVYQALPPDQQATTAILTGNYGETGAINLLGRDQGLPIAISGADNAWYRGYGDPPPERVIVVGIPQSEALRLFHTCHIRGRVVVPQGVINRESSISAVLLCENLRQDWDAAWADLKSFQ